MPASDVYNAMMSGARTSREIRDSDYRFNQARAQGRAYRGSVDPKTGKPIGTAYIQQLISEGVDVDPALAQAARMADIYKHGSEAAQSGIGMESTGANPRRTILAAPDEIQAAQTRLDQPGFFGRMFGKAKPAATQTQAAAPQYDPDFNPAPDAMADAWTNKYVADTKRRLSAGVDSRINTADSGTNAGTNDRLSLVANPAGAASPLALKDRDWKDEALRSIGIGVGSIAKPLPSGPADISASSEASSTRGGENYQSGTNTGTSTNTGTGTSATMPASSEASDSEDNLTPGGRREQMNLGSGNVTGYVEAPLVSPPLPDRAQESNPPVDDYFSSMLRDVSLQGAQQAAGVSAQQQQPPDDSMFKWAPTDVDGNVYMQYSKSLDNFIKSNGYESSSDYLQKTYDAALKQNTPQMPSAMLLAFAPAEYYKQMSAYQAGVQQAQGKAQQAVMEARKGLDEIAKKMGEDTVKQRETELDKDYVLRDKTYRPKAVALLTNRSNIGMIDKDLKTAVAKNDIAQLRLVAPAVIRAYATALNPDMQLSDGNLREIGAMLSPELATDKQFLLQLAIGLKRSMFNGDDSVLDGLLKSAEQSSGVGLGVRLSKILEHSKVLNGAALGKYVIRITPEEPDGQAGGGQGLEQSFTVPGSTPTGNPAMQAAGVGAILSNAKSNATKNKSKTAKKSASLKGMVF